PPRDPVARVGLDPRREALVRGPHLGDLLAFLEGVRKRLDPVRPQALQLLAPVTKNVGGLWLLSSTHQQREPIWRPSPQGWSVLYFFVDGTGRQRNRDPPKKLSGTPAATASGALDLRDFELLLRPARRLDLDDVVALVAEQGFADRRLVGELVLDRVGLGRA